jgi:hypothetical protein
VNARGRHFGILGCAITAGLAFLAQSTNAQSSRAPGAVVLPDKRAIGPHSAEPAVGKFERDSVDLKNDDSFTRAQRDQQWRGLVPDVLKDPGTNAAIGMESTTVSHIDYVGEGPAALPTDRSDLVIVGQVLRSSAFVTPDKTGVYSEFPILVQSVLKGDSSSISKTVIGIRGGGTVTFPSGHKRKILFDGMGYPQTGPKYLFFLHKMPGTALDYGILTAYELSGTSVYALDNVEPFTKYEGAEQATFLQTIKNQIALKQ